jgi:hypothetical protein
MLPATPEALTDVLLLLLLLLHYRNAERCVPRNSTSRQVYADISRGAYRTMMH